MNHLHFGVQKFESMKDMESNSFKYSFIKMMGGSHCDQINHQGFENKASMGPFDSWKVKFCERGA